MVFATSSAVLVFILTFEERAHYDLCNSIRSDNALLVCGDTTGKLCVLSVIEKAPGSVLLEKTLRVRYQACSIILFL